MPPRAFDYLLFKIGSTGGHLDYFLGPGNHVAHEQSRNHLNVRSAPVFNVWQLDKDDCQFSFEQFQFMANCCPNDFRSADSLSRHETEVCFVLLDRGNEDFGGGIDDVVENFRVTLRISDHFAQCPKAPLD